MCTVTFFPRDAGYYLAMNRDEQLARIAGLPPQLSVVDGRRILCPSEPRGGTWISLNEAGVCFSLINWYAAPARVTAGVLSRGDVVKVTSPAGNSSEAEERIAGLALHLTNPFRLIGIFPGEHEVVEWRWDLRKLVRHARDWEPRQWISSGFDEPKAQSCRSATFENWRRDPAAGELEWLRQLHASHSPERGPFSTCMHRKEAGTVSYTEVIAGAEKLEMIYRPGHPCESSAGSGFCTESESVSLHL